MYKVVIKIVIVKIQDLILKIKIEKNVLFVIIVNLKNEMWDRVYVEHHWYKSTYTKN